LLAWQTTGERRAARGGTGPGDGRPCNLVRAHNAG
jgi:hypothetical protein